MEALEEDHAEDQGGLGFRMFLEVAEDDGFGWLEAVGLDVI